MLPEELIFFLETDVLDGELGEGVVNLLLFVLLVPLEHPDEEELTADLANQENKQNQKNKSVLKQVLVDEPQDGTGVYRVIQRVVP